jgi:outer membrane protein assembly factor BamD (BamD/ComL family)
MGRMPRVTIVIIQRLSLFLCFFFSWPLFALDFHFQNKKESVSFQFSGLESWDYKTEFKSGKLKIILPKLSKESVKKLKSIQEDQNQSQNKSLSHKQNHQIQIYQINTEESSLTDFIEVTIPPDYDYFDYILQKPSRLVFDFYNKKVKDFIQKSNEDQSEKTIQNEKKNKAQNLNQDKKRSPSNVDILRLIPFQDLSNQDKSKIENQNHRNNQRAHFKEDASLIEYQDITRSIFEQSLDRFRIPKSEMVSNPLLKFYMGDYIEYPFLDERLVLLENMKLNMPEYQIQKVDPENLLPEKKQQQTHAELLLALFRRNRNFVFLKTASWFEKTYPQSVYEEILRAMWGDTHYKLYLEDPIKNKKHLDLAKLRYEELIEKFPHSKLVPRIQIFMGYSSIGDQDYLSALRWFQRFSNSFLESDILSVAVLGKIQSLVGLNQVNEALKEIEDLKKTLCQNNKSCQIKADLFKADIYIKQKNWEKAEEAFNKISKSYSLEDIKEERYFYNFALVLFNQKKFLSSLDLFLEFLKHYPQDHYSGYALTRIGEIIDMHSSDPNRALGAYLEANFRHGVNPGSTAVFARIRLLEKKLAFVKGRSRQMHIDEIIQLSKKEKLPMSEDFGNFIVSGELLRIGDYEQSLHFLIPTYRNKPTHSLNSVYFSKIQNVQSKKMVSLSQSQPLEALKFHKFLKKDWLKGKKRMDVTFAIAESYFSLGDYKSASLYYEDFIKQKTQYLLDTVKKEVEFYHQNPASLSTAYLKLAETNKKQKQWSLAFQALKKLDESSLILSSVEQVQRASLMSEILKEKGQTDYSLRYLKDMRRLASETPDRTLDLISQEISALKKGQDYKSIVSLSSEIQGLCQNQEMINQCYHAERDILKAKKQTLNVDSYQKDLQEFIEKYESDFDLDDLKYELGQKYLEQKKVSLAKKLWSRFKKPSSGWALLAESDLKGVDFDSLYEDYIKEIPFLKKEESPNQEELK